MQQQNKLRREESIRAREACSRNHTVLKEICELLDASLHEEGAAA